MIPAEDWIWDGHAGHFILAYKCGFRLNTRVGNYRISTVGDLPADGDERGEMQDIGFSRKFETLVFPVAGDGPGEVDEWLEIDTDTYNACDDARLGHIAMCKKYAEKQP